MLELLAELFAKAKLLTLVRRGKKPLAIDSTCFERRHRSGYYDRRCRRMATADADADAGDAEKRPGSWGKAINDARAASLRQACGACPSWPSPSTAAAT
jgi:hypothetical protein